MALIGDPVMLHEFLTSHREELIERCRAKVAKRPAPCPTKPERHNGISLFLEQLTRILLREQTSISVSRASSGPEQPGNAGSASEIGATALTHGHDLFDQGLTVDQVVHDYGDLCQAVAELAIEQRAPITTEEFRTLNLCLDNAIAGAVTEYGRQHDQLIAEKGIALANERLGVLAHELRNLLNTAMLAVVAIKSGSVGLAGATGAVLDRSLVGMRDLIDRSFAEVRLATALPTHRARISVSEFLQEAHVTAALDAQVRGIKFTASRVAHGLWLDADPAMLSSAVTNLLHNAFKFTKPHSQVWLSGYATADRILIEVEDQCGGLPDGIAEDLFRPFEQRSRDRTGLGLGLSISRRSVEANDGELRVRNIPGIGCVFTIDLPKTS